MGRKPLGKVAMTNAEKQARHRAKIRAELNEYRGTAATPDGIAKERFINYVTKKLKGEYDTTAWEFWTWLLGQAEWHKLDFSGYASIEFQKDRDIAKSRR